MTLSDRDLIEQIKGGDTAVFKALLGCYQERVYRLATSMTRNREDAEDVLQDVFLAVYRKIGNFESRSASLQGKGQRTPAPPGSAVPIGNRVFR